MFQSVSYLMCIRWDLAGDFVQLGMSPIIIQTWFVPIFTIACHIFGGDLKVTASQ